jgi:hypothetical protein
MFPSVRGEPGNAETSRTRNLQCFEMTPQPPHPPGDVDISRLRNLQVFEMTPQEPHPPGDANVSRLRNLQVFEMSSLYPPGDAYVSRVRNLQVFEMTPQVHPPGDVYFSRMRNLQVFEMTPQPPHPPGDANVTRLRNLQCFEMAYQIHEVKINVTYLATTDQSGNQTIDFLKGDVVQVNFTVSNTGVPFANALISTVILDPSNDVFFLSYTFRDFSVGTKANIIFGFRIPEDAPAGTYTLKVMVFTDWPSEGGVGLDVKIATFNVS